MINNVEIYGLEESVRASKFPMSIDTDSCTTCLPVPEGTSPVKGNAGDVKSR